MNKFLLSLMLIPTIALGAIKSDSKGGGGGSVVACYTPEGELKSVELLDIYEGRTKGQTFAELSGDLDTDLNQLAAKLKRADYEAQDFVKSMKGIRANFEFIPRDSELEIIQDAWPVYLPRGCKPKQLANYYNDSVIFVDEVLYEKMDYRNQLALLIHEGLYVREREFGVTDSRYARLITSLLFSTKDPFTPTKYDGVTHICRSWDKKTAFFARPLSETENRWQFIFNMLNGHRIYSEKTVTMKIGNSPLSQHDPVSVPPGWESEEEGRFDLSQLSTATMDSKINPNEPFMVWAKPNALKISWKGTDPKDSINEMTVICNEMYFPTAE